MTSICSCFPHCFRGVVDSEGSNDILPRVIVSIDTKTLSIKVRRESLAKEVYALSHRWVDRTKEDIQTWLVHCEGEKEYEAYLYPHEVSYLQNYLNDYQKPLWLDYICIDQSSDDDKNAQVSIMGGIYLNYTTLIVGNNLDPVLPVEEYFGRGWTFQERKFGKIKFPFDITTLSKKETIDLGYKFIVAIPDLDFCADKLLGEFIQSEQWRVSCADFTVKKLEEEGEAEKADLVLKAKQFMVERKTYSLAKIALEYRCLLDINYLPDDPTKFGGNGPDVTRYQIEMFNVNVSVKKDCLFGIWGVPMKLKNVTLDYSDPMSSWRSVAKAYPWADFAYYSKDNTPDISFLNFTQFAEVETVIGCLLSDGSEEQYIKPEAAKVLETSVHEFYRDSGTNTKFTLAWGENCVGVACKFGCSEALPEGPFHFVVGYQSLQVVKSEDSAFSFYLNFRNTVGAAFDKLIIKLWKLNLCIAKWEETWHMQHELAITLHALSQKHKSISKYNKYFQFPDDL